MLATHYEQLRERALGGGGNRGIGMAVVRRQGLWVWMMLVPAQTDDSARRSSVPPVAILSSTPPPVRSELLAVWSGLVLDTVIRQGTS